MRRGMRTNRLKRVPGRMPVIVTGTHFAVEFAQEKACQPGAWSGVVMSMPQFFGNRGADLLATHR